MAAPIRVYSIQSFAALDILLPHRSITRMATKPLKGVIGRDEPLERNRGEYLHVCYDGPPKLVAVPISHESGKHPRIPQNHGGKSGSDKSTPRKGIAYP
jgi:hypothetical protein